MVRPNALSFRIGNFSAGAADRSLSHARRNADRGAFLHGPGSDRTEVRHRAGAFTGDVPGVCATTSARIFALLYLASLQTDAAQCYQQTRTITGGRDGPRTAQTRFLERRGERSASFARRNLPIARGRRLALLD